MVLHWYCTALWFEKQTNIQSNVREDSDKRIVSGNGGSI